ncbi:MAG: GatB/YqeY domain-containing protein, partial [Nitrosopumilaceae archaeon]
IVKTFQSLSEGKISKESIEIIFESIMAGKAKSVEEVIQKVSLGNIDEDKLNKILDEIIQKNSELIKKQGQRSIGPIMGIVMKELRGKADGETINKLLNKKINLELNNKN